MAKVIIVYDSRFGNTEKVAQSLAKGLETGGITSDLVRASDNVVNQLQEYDALLVGCPTHAWRPSKPVKDFLEALDESSMKGKKAFAFDTKYSSRFAGSAAKHIEKALSKQGAAIIRKRASAIVEGNEGPLVTGTENKFTDIGREIATLLQ
jgi:flavodoxin